MEEPSQFTLDAVKHTAEQNADTRLSIKAGALQNIIARAERSEAEVKWLKQERDNIVALFTKDQLEHSAAHMVEVLRENGYDPTLETMRKAYKYFVEVVLHDVTNTEDLGGHLWSMCYNIATTESANAWAETHQSVIEEWNAETPLGQQLDGGGDEVEP
jgi:hypothetical protein